MGSCEEDNKFLGYIKRVNFFTN